MADRRCGERRDKLMHLSLAVLVCIVFVVFESQEQFAEMNCLMDVFSAALYSMARHIFNDAAFDKADTVSVDVFHRLYFAVFVMTAADLGF